jgi:hypothetical protein
MRWPGVLKRINNNVMTCGVGNRLATTVQVVSANPGQLPSRHFHPAQPDSKLRGCLVSQTVQVNKIMQCNETLLMHVLDSMDSLHVLAELLKLVTPAGYYLDDVVSPAQQKRDIDRVLKHISKAQYALDTFRQHVSPEADTPADKETFALAVKRIKDKMINDMDEFGYYTGRAMDRQAFAEIATRDTSGN